MVTKIHGVNIKLHNIINNRRTIFSSYTDMVRVSFAKKINEARNCLDHTIPQKKTYNKQFTQHNKLINQCYHNYISQKISW